MMQISSSSSSPSMVERLQPLFSWHDWFGATTMQRYISQSEGSTRTGKENRIYGAFNLGK